MPPAGVVFHDAPAGFGKGELEKLNDARGFRGNHAALFLVLSPRQCRLQFGWIHRFGEMNVEASLDCLGAI